MLTQISPNPSPTTGGELTLLGSSFGPCTIVRWQRGSSSYYWPLPTTFVSPTELRVTFPGHPMDPGKSFVVYTPGGGFSAAITVELRPFPIIRWVSPRTASAGGPLLRITVSSPDEGFFFNSSSEAGIVALDGVRLSNAVFVGPYGWDRWRSASVDVPAELLVTKRVGKITFTTPGIGTSKPFDFPIE